MKKILLAALTCAMVSLTGCDKLKDAVSRDIKVNNVKFEFAATTNDDAVETLSAVTTRAATLRTFSVTRTVDISEMGNSEIMEYASKIKNVEVNSSQLTVTASPAGNFTVSNVLVKAVGVAGEMSVPSYTLGNAFPTPDGMDSFIGAFISKLLTAKTVSVTVSGQTDAPAGTTINVSFESNLILTASLL